MKPTKNRVYCRDAGRQKMVFETEKKAITFMQFNNQEIESESGYSPNRSYFCISCNGWHVTSKKERINIISKTELVLELYKVEKEKKVLWKAKMAEINKANTDALNKHLNTLERYIKRLGEAKVNGNNRTELFQLACDELEIAKELAGMNKRKRTAEEKLKLLEKEFRF